MPKGYPVNPEKTSKLRSIAQKNRVWSEETKLKVKEILIKRNKSKEHIAKVKKALKGHGFSEETLEKMRNNHKDTFGSNNPRWNGGVYIDKYGYKLLFKPGHPTQNKKGYVREHRLLIEETIGRMLLKAEVVHHIDGKRLNNNINNLMLLKDGGAHRRVHCNKSVNGDVLFDGSKYEKT